MCAVSTSYEIVGKDLMTGKEQELSDISRKVKEILPELTIPPKVIVAADTEPIYPPTIADDLPNRILVVRASKNGAIDAYINASSTNLFGYRVDKSTDKVDGETTVLVYYYEKGDPRSSPVAPGARQKVVLAASARPTQKLHVGSDSQKKAILDIASELSRQKMNRGYRVQASR